VTADLDSGFSLCAFFYFGEFAHAEDLFFFCIFYSVRNARIASAVLATAIPFVRLSICHTPVLCQNDGT